MQTGYIYIYTVLFVSPACDSRGFEEALGVKGGCQKHVTPPLAAASPGAAGLRRRPQAYLDGGHLRVSSPAEALELQRVVTKAHSPASRRGAFLQFEFQVVEVWEIMVPRGSGEEREHVTCWAIWREG